MKITWIEDTPYCPYCEDSALYLTQNSFYCAECHRSYGQVSGEELTMSKLKGQCYPRGSIRRKYE